jgi:hypothetical protein
MTFHRRVALKLLWMAVLALLLALFEEVRHEFVYQAF